MSPTPSHRSELPEARWPIESARSVVAFVNETAGAGPKHRHLAGLREVLGTANFDLQVVNQFEELGPIVKDFEKRGSLRAVLAVGGDGTVGAVLNATPPGTPICVLPLGTEN